MLVSILLPDLGAGGAERVSIDLARQFVLAGYEVEFVLMRAEGQFLYEAKRQFSVVDLGVDRVRGVPRALARHLQKNRPDVLIASMWPLTSMAVLGRVLSGQVCKLLLVEHCVLSSQYSGKGLLHSIFMRASMSCTYPFADGIAAVSKGAAEDLRRQLVISSGRVHVLYNPIPSRGQPSEDQKKMAEALWQCPPRERLLAVGTFKSQKNLPLLLNAFAKLSRAETRLMLVGQGEEEERLRELANELQISDRVIFAGFHVDPSPFYATASAYVLSSNDEGFGNVLVEALSFGLPVVSTDCPSGPSEILEKGRWGRLVPVGNAQALAEAMNTTLSQAVDREALKQRAADFAPEVSAGRYFKLLGLSPALGSRV